MATIVYHNGADPSALQVNGQDVPRNSACGPTGFGDYVTLEPNSAAQIRDGTTIAAYLSTGGSATPTSIQTVSPYVQSMYQVYYNRSYRWQLTCPSGSIGIRI